jgi:hypothetical protein
MAHNTNLRNYLAGAAVAAYRIVKPGAADGEVLQGAAATDFLNGINDSVAPASGERVDIVKSGIADVEYGGNVTRGQPLTSDADGKAVAAAPAAGANVRIIGFAEVSGVAGDIGLCLIAPGVMQGA